MKVAFYCSNSNPSKKAFNLIISKGFDIAAVFISGKKIDNFFIEKCNLGNIKLVPTSIEIPSTDVEYDVLISFSYRKLISKKEIETAKIAVNFHPAPLPKYRGVATNMWAIINNESEWGATSHFINEQYDMGYIIECRKFTIDKSVINTGMDLSIKSWDVCLELLSETLDKIRLGQIIKGTECLEKDGNFYSKSDLENIKKIDMSEDPKLIIRKIKGLWFPPYKGAYTIVDNQKVYLVTEELLSEFYKDD